MSSQKVKKLYDAKKENNHSMRERLRIWLLEHPELNPYRFSVGLTLDPDWYKNPNKFSIGRAFQMATNGIRTLPNFIIIGSSKSGTWAIHNYLLQHPDIDYSARNIHFFEYVYSDKISWYKSHFPTKLYKSLVKSIGKRKCLIGEHTPTYIHHPLVPQRVKDGIPDVKLLVSLRNPIDRAYSNYHHQVRDGYEKRTFEDAVFSEIKRIEIIKDNDNLQIKNPNFSNYVQFNYLRHGTYVDKLENWLKIFPREQFCIVENKDLSKNPQQVLDKIFEFLNVPHFKLRQEERWNVGKYKKMKESTRKTLADFFRSYNERLYKLLGQNFGWN
jgi:hypothetical protein